MAVSTFKPKPPKTGRPFVSRSKRIRGKLPQQDEHRINERIRVSQVRLVDEKGGQVGVVDTAKAYQRAKDVGLDLVEVAPNARPPVCKILDYGKFKYEKKKKENQARKSQTVIKIKEVQVRPNTDVHDYNFKVRNARHFLEEGDKVKVSMLFRGRQMAHTDVGRKMMKQIIEEVKDVSTVSQQPKLDGRRMIMILAPTRKKLSLSAKKAAKEKEKKTSAPKKK